MHAPPPPLPVPPKKRNTARLVLGASVFLYVAACTMPALEFQKTSRPDVWPGAAILLMGWLGIFTGVPAWLANPIWLLAALLTFLARGTGAARILSVLALLLGLSTFTMFAMELPGDEGGVTKTHLSRLLPGAYLWLLSLGGTVAAAFLAHENRK